VAERSPEEFLLDLFVYAPIGAVLVLAEELPKLAERGRREVDTRMATARAVGEFAVRFGRAELRRRTEQLFATVFAPRAAPEGSTAPQGASGTAPMDREGAEGPGGRAREQTAPPSAPPPAGADGAEHPRHVARRDGPRAIPGYDTLSASQVVRRLEGLSPAELEELRAYELATRARRTVLAKVNQLLAQASTRPDGP
jgi:hypothetical protein